MTYTLCNFFEFASQALTLNPHVSSVLAYLLSDQKALCLSSLQLGKIPKSDNHSGMYLKSLSTSAGSAPERGAHYCNNTSFSIIGKTTWCMYSVIMSKLKVDRLEVAYSLITWQTSGFYSRNGSKLRFAFSRIQNFCF